MLLWGAGFPFPFPSRGRGLSASKARRLAPQLVSGRIWRPQRAVSLLIEGMSGNKCQTLGPGSLQPLFKKGKAQPGDPKLGSEPGTSAAVMGVSWSAACPVSSWKRGVEPIYFITGPPTPPRAGWTIAVSSHKCPHLTTSHLSFPSWGFTLIPWSITNKCCRYDVRLYTDTASLSS